MNAKQSGDRLWAKSRKQEEEERPSMGLEKHLKDVHESAQRVVEATEDDQLRALGLEPEKYQERLRRCVRLAAACHDLGKANDHFQEMVRGVRDVLVQPQGLRHEWVTVLMFKDLREWLLPAVGGSEDDLAVVEWAIAGHHPAQHHQSPPRLCPPGAGAELKVMADHADFRPILEWLAKTFELKGETPVVASGSRQLTGPGNVFQEIAKWAREERGRWERLSKQDDGKGKRFIAAVKNTLVAADVAGSALPRNAEGGVTEWKWITDSFEKKPKPGDLQMIVDERVKTFTERDEEREEFQRRVAASTDLVTFVKGGCGSGKTQAAYMWAREQHPGKRLYFCYPTTGTATEGYRDYLHIPNVGADLFHSRREVDFEILLGTGRDTRNPEREEAIRIESLDAWSTPIVACTVDTVLGLVQNNRRGLLGWPAVAGAAFVFDEIHAYDDRLFGALLRFLRDVPGAPVLQMTASLPDARLEALKFTVAKVHRKELVPIPGPEGLEMVPRYKRLADKGNDPVTVIRETVKGGRKVLWVCNTVGRVMNAADKVPDLSPQVYHSRFKYKDRVERHKAVIRVFKETGGSLAICSQVAEMSLDLSADLLVTDLATVPALIQRLGRLNRWATKENKTLKPFIVVEPENHLPYTAAELDAARRWLGDLEKFQTKGISQRDLAEQWEQLAENPPDLVPSAWLDGGPATTVLELREASPGISVLMEEDMKKIEINRKLLGQHVLPMPPPPRGLDWRLEKPGLGIPVAREGTILYDGEGGAAWVRS